MQIECTLTNTTPTTLVCVGFILFLESLTGEENQKVTYVLVWGCRSAGPLMLSCAWGTQERAGRLLSAWQRTQPGPGQSRLEQTPSLARQIFKPTEMTSHKEPKIAALPINARLGCNLTGTSSSFMPKHRLRLSLVAS